jgi:putative hydrolase of HD superfamily
MDAHELIKALRVAERLKDATRHCYTSGGRQESVAEHSWRISLMAYFIKDKFPEANINKVIQMCLIHDLGEAFTGDIPTFIKTQDDKNKEESLLYSWVKTLPAPFDKEMFSLYQEMSEQKTLEAKLYKAMDSLEALIQHNESNINTWSENEYGLNLVYADDRVNFSSFLKELREHIREETIEKIETINN